MTAILFEIRSYYSSKWAFIHDNNAWLFLIRLAQDEEDFSILGMTDSGANLYYVDKYNKTSFSYTIRYFALCDCPGV